MDDVKYNNSLKKYGPTFTDIIFLIVVAFVMAGVAWVGSLAYHEGTKTEATKQNGEAWAKWFSNAGAARAKAGYAPVACATGLVPVVIPAPIVIEMDSEVGTELINQHQAPPPPSPPAPRTWGPCLKEITSPDGPLANTINPFTKKPLLIVTKCDMADRALAGSIALEKIMPTPPGSAIPFINTPMIDTDPIDQKMPIRITMCDKGAYPIRIAEVEF